MNETKGATGEQVQVCLQQRRSNGFIGWDFSRTERMAIRLQYRACVRQAVALNNGQANSNSSQSSFTVLPPVSTCSDLYWFDNTNSGQCQEQKQFCGAYMYYGLQTFINQKDCLNALSVASGNCTPNWRCDWGACTNGWQSQTPVDSSNCGGATGNIVCPALARQCTPPTQCKADTDCPTVCSVCTSGISVSCGGSCITFKCVSGKCVANTTPSITVTSPNGGETYKNDGSPITVNWQTNNVPSSQKFDVIRLRAYPNGQEYNLAYNVLNDGHEVLVPSSVPVGAYTLEIKTYVNGILVMDSSDSYFKIIDATIPIVSEQVKCVFNGTTTAQKCYTATSDSSSAFACSGIGTCVTGVKGPQGTSLTWKSSCGGYAYSTLDGNNESVNFSCPGTTTPPAEIDTSVKINQSVTLGAASTFGVLAGSTVTNTGPTTITGNLGVSPGTAVTGFAPGVVNDGAIHAADTLASQAKVALTIAYNNLAGRSTNPVSVSGNLGGSTLSPGLYKSTSSLEISSGDLTLDAKGDSNAIFVFQIASTLNVSVGRNVVLIGGAKASNIFWQVGTSANLEANSIFKGTILADQSISLQTGARVDGRLLARIGAVTLQGNAVTVPGN